MENDIYKHRVKQIMTRNVVSLLAESAIEDALTLMMENRISALPVVDSKNHCVGILTSTDLVNLTSDVDDDVKKIDLVDTESHSWLVERLVRTFGKEPVASFIQNEVFTVTEETTLAIAAREMLRNQVHHLPVVDQQNHVVGIISTMDILAEFADGG